MTLSKFFKSLAVILAGVLMMAFLGGCGNSEKFAGHWIGYGKDGYPKETDCIYDVTIEKNGKDISSIWMKAAGSWNRLRAAIGKTS